MPSTDGLYAHSVKFFVFHTDGTLAGWSIETRDAIVESPETDPIGPALCATDSDAFSINSPTLSAVDSEGQRSGVLKLKVAASLGFEPRKTLPRGFHGLNMLDCHGDREVVYVAASLGFEPRQGI